jgi:hypothetical protein
MSNGSRMAKPVYIPMTDAEWNVLSPARQQALISAGKSSPELQRGARRADCKPHVAKNSRSTGRHCLIYRPSSRTGENPLSGMIGGTMETSASSKPGPRHCPTRPLAAGADSNLQRLLERG